MSSANSVRIPKRKKEIRKVYANRDPNPSQQKTRRHRSASAPPSETCQSNEHSEESEPSNTIRARQDQNSPRSQTPSHTRSVQAPPAARGVLQWPCHDLSCDTSFISV
jgi:hypothetical protein